MEKIKIFYQNGKDPTDVFLPNLSKAKETAHSQQQIKLKRVSSK